MGRALRWGFLLFFLIACLAEASFVFFRPRAIATPFAACGGANARCAAFQNFTYATPWTTEVVDGLTALTVPPGNPSHASQICATLNFAMTNARLSIEAIAPETSFVWVRLGLFGAYPNSTTEASVLFQGMAQGTFAFTTIGQRATRNLLTPDPESGRVVNSTETRLFTFTNPTTLCVHATAGVKLLNIHLDPDHGTPVRPDDTPVGGPDILIHRVTSRPTIDSSTWDTAPLFPRGYNSGVGDLAKCQSVWVDAATDELCTRCEETLANLEWTPTTAVEDDGTISQGTAMGVQYRPDTNPTLDGNTIRIVVNPALSIYDAHWGGTNNSFTSTYDLSDRAATTSSNVNRRRMQVCHDLPANVAQGQRIKIETIQWEKVTGGSVKFTTACNPSSNVSNVADWCEGEIAGDLPAAPADTTAPSFTGTSEVGTPGATSATLRATAQDNVSTILSFYFEYGIGNYNSRHPIGSATITSTGDCASPSTCTGDGLITSLTPSSTYQWRAVARDASGNTTTSAGDTFTTAAAGTLKYIATTGNDSTGTGTSGNPWRTPNFGAKQLNPGETLIVKDGIYTTGLIDLNCNLSNNGKNGTASQPITVKAENEGFAIFKDDGEGFQARFQNCSYWILEGLQFIGGNISTTAPSGNIAFYYGSNNTLRRSIIAYSNACANTNPVLFYASHNYEITENVIVDWHRNALNPKYTTGGIITRNYFNSRNRANACSYTPAPNNIGDGGVSLYPASGAKVFNNIVEKAAGAYEILATSTSINNWFKQNIAIGGIDGLHIFSREGGTTDTYTPRNNTVEDFIALNPSSIGIYLRSAGMTILRRFLVTGTGNDGFVSTLQPTCCTGSGVYGFRVEKGLVVNRSQRGFFVDPAANTAPYSNDWAMDIVQAYNAGVLFNPTQAASGGRITQSLTTDPNIGACRLWHSSLANFPRMLYKLNDSGVETGEKLWDSAQSGRWRFGIENYDNTYINLETDSYKDVHTRIGQAACGWPGGY